MFRTFYHLNIIGKVRRLIRGIRVFGIEKENEFITERMWNRYFCRKKDA